MYGFRIIIIWALINFNPVKFGYLKQEYKWYCLALVMHFILTRTHFFNWKRKIQMKTRRVVIAKKEMPSEIYR